MKDRNADPAWISGDPWLQCDRSGFKVRKSQTRQEWNGLIVRKVDWEPRHPQDFVRGRADKQSFPGARPEPVEDVFLGANEVKRENL